MHKPGLSGNKTAANINMDGLSRFAKTKDITIVGEGQSELEEYIKKEVENDGGYILIHIPKRILLLLRSF
jgi:hypothetical protein